MKPRAIMHTHPSFPFSQYQDATGPERILSFYDPASQMRAVIVIDTTAFGMSAGGVRMLPDLSVEEMARLARAMTYKYLMLEFPAGGAKAGIWYDPATQDRQAVMDAFLQVLQPLYERRSYYPGADMGTSDDDFLPLRNELGKRRYSGLRTKHFEGLPLEDQLTGFGVVESALVAAKSFQLPIRNATVAIEGFGKVGGGAARFIVRAGAQVVAVSTLTGTRYDPRGLDVERLLELRQEYGDETVRHYRGGRLLSRRALFTLPVDILIPGARPDVIHAKNVDRIQARLVVPAREHSVSAVDCESPVPARGWRRARFCLKRRRSPGRTGRYPGSRDQGILCLCQRTDSEEYQAGTLTEQTLALYAV